MTKKDEKTGSEVVARKFGKGVTMQLEYRGGSYFVVFVARKADGTKATVIPFIELSKLKKDVADFAGKASLHHKMTKSNE